MTIANYLVNHELKLVNHECTLVFYGFTGVNHELKFFWKWFSEVTLVNKIVKLVKIK